MLFSLSAQGSGLYTQASIGPAFATYFPIDNGGIAEHFARSGIQSAVGAGYSFDVKSLRFDVGLRIQHLHENVEGSYSLTEVGDAYLANYDYLAGLVELSVATRMGARVNAFLGFTLGSSLLFSDRKGEPLRHHALPVFGTFEGGLLIRLLDGVEGRVALSWLPPWGGLNVFAPVFGFRADL